MTNSSTTVDHPTALNPDAAEDLLASIRLGERIKKLRLKRSMGLVELGKRSGLSASFLSQLETGRVVPTLRNLSRIGIVFGKDLSYFFESSDSTAQHVFRIQRKDTRVRLPVGSPMTNYIAESFSILIPEGGLRPCIAEFLPGEDRQPFQPDIYPGIEMVYVMSGSIELSRHGEAHNLSPGDVCYISGETVRAYRCTGQQSAQALIISFDTENGEPRRRQRIAANLVS